MLSERELNLIKEIEGPVFNKRTLVRKANSVQKQKEDVMEGGRQREMSTFRTGW